MRLLQEEGGYTSSLYIYEDSEGYEPLAKIESDLRSLYQSADSNAAEVAQHPATDTEAERHRSTSPPPTTSTTKTAGPLVHSIRSAVLLLIL